MGEKMNIFDKLASVFEKEDKTTSIHFDRTIDVPGYKVGGEDRNLHVVQCESWIAYLHRSKGLIFDKKDIGVKPMICTAIVDDPDTKRMLRKLNSDAPDDMVIVVNKKFMSFFTFQINAFRVALLEGQSYKSHISRDENLQVIEQADVARWVGARNGHSNFVVNHAFDKADKNFRRQNEKFASAVKRETKKNSGNRCIFNRVYGFKEA